MLDFNIKVLETCASTNDDLKSYIHKDEGFVVQALTQTKGRGRQGREWVAAEGNLYLSLLLKPESQSAYLGQIALLLGLAVSNALDEIDVNGSHLKWPNDVLIEGQKVCGILIEVEQGTLICGIGVNISQSTIEGSTNLHAYNAQIERDYFRDILFEEINVLYAHWQLHGFEAIRKSWLEKAWQLGKMISIHQQNTKISGIFKTLDNTGRIVLEDSDGDIHKIQTGDVFKT